MNIIENGKNAMDVMTDEQTKALECVLKTIDKSLLISEINYNEGFIRIGMTYNRGKPEEFIENDFMTVNVGMDSVPAEMYDVIDKVFHRCI